MRTTRRTLLSSGAATNRDLPLSLPKNYGWKVGQARRSAREAGYVKNKYDHTFTVETASDAETTIYESDRAQVV